MHPNDQDLFVMGSVGTSPIRPRADEPAVIVRQRKSCASSSALGFLKLKTSQPCGLIPVRTWLMAPSFPEYIHPWKMGNTGITVGRIQQAPSAETLSSANVTAVHEVLVIAADL